MTSNQTDDQKASELPQDIVDKISEYLKNDVEKLLPILTFFIDYDNQSTKRYLTVLRSVFTNDVAFNQIVDKLAEDTQILENDLSYLRFMADTRNNCLIPNEKNVCVNGQRFDFRLVLSNNLTKTTAVFNFISTLSKLDSTVQNKVIQLITNIAEAKVFDNKTLDNNFKNLLQLTKSTSSNLVSNSLVTVFLTYETVTQLQLWWRGEISGRRCSKNIVDSFAGMAAGVGGGIVGATAGSYIINGFGLKSSPTPLAIGSIIGAVIGGVTSATAANKISDWLTQKLFNLPKNAAAVENHYKFLGLEYGASNDEINLSFWQLALALISTFLFGFICCFVIFSQRLLY